MMTTTRSLYVFARAPERGRVKTRLAAELGDAAALGIYDALLEDVCAMAGGVAARRVLAVEGELAHPRLVRFAEAYGLERVAQGAGDLGAKMARALADGIGRGGPAVIIGTDSPQLVPAAIEAAFRALEDAEVVLGPALDGGYWLVGARGQVPPIFDAMPWGTARVFDDTLRRLAAPPAILGAEVDVDGVASLVELGGLLLGLPPTVAPATRAAVRRWAPDHAVA